MIHHRRTNGSLLAILACGVLTGSAAAQFGGFGQRTTYDVGASPYSVASTDLNDNGAADLVVANVRNDTVSVLLGDGDGTFRPQQTFDAGPSPVFIILGDLNGNGVADIVTSNDGSQDPRSVSVLLGNGDGTFAAKTDYSVGRSPWSVAMGDLTGNGIPDLVTTNRLDNSISILEGNGDGTFKAQRTYPVGDGPRTVGIGDLNGDGHMDLAIVNTNDESVTVLVNDGAGNFQHHFTAEAGSRPRSIIVADLNGDGVLDLGMVNTNDDSVSILLGNGDATFAPEQRYPVGSVPHVLIAADLSGDGHLDIAIANRGPNPFSGNTVSVLLNAGDATFPTHHEYDAGSNPWSVTAADFNNNGVLDLALPNEFSGTISVLLNQTEPCIADWNRDGEVDINDFFAYLADFEAGDPRADLNGDGHIDIADFFRFLSEFAAGC